MWSRAGSARTFYRLNVIPILIPPLRERKEDIYALALDMLDRHNARHGCRKRLSPEVIDLLLSHSFPGNARELGNIMEWMLVMSEGNVLRPEDLPLCHAAGRGGAGGSPGRAGGRCREPGLPARQAPEGHPFAVEEECLRQALHAARPCMRRPRCWACIPPPCGASSRSTTWDREVRHDGIRGSSGESFQRDGPGLPYPAGGPSRTGPAGGRRSISRAAPCAARGATMPRACIFSRNCAMYRSSASVRRPAAGAWRYAGPEASSRRDRIRTAGPWCGGSFAASAESARRSAPRGALAGRAGHDGRGHRAGSGKDRDFYRTSGGGLTLSGGEPLVRPTLAAAVMTLAHQRDCIPLSRPAAGSIWMLRKTGRPCGIAIC